MRAFLKSLCWTLVFFAYSFLLFCGGIVFQRQVLAQSEEKDNEVVETQTDMNIAAHKTAEEYHKYYEIVVSRIKTTDFESLNKKALDAYILAHNERLEALIDAFYPDKDDATKYGSSFPMVYANFRKAYEEAELFTYKQLMLAMSTMDIDEDIERIFKDNQVYNLNTQTPENPSDVENTDGAANDSENTPEDAGQKQKPADEVKNREVSNNLNNVSNELPRETPYY